MAKVYPNGGKAVIEDGAIVIRVPLDTLGLVLDGAWAMSGPDRQRFKVTDAAVFAAEVAHKLNEEDEQGTTLIHRMFDKAFFEAIDYGAEGVELHEQQEA
jgi:hypothetical protein